MRFIGLGIDEALPKPEEVSGQEGLQWKKRYKEKKNNFNSLTYLPFFIIIFVTLARWFGV